MHDFIRDRTNLPAREIPVLVTIDVCDGAYEPGSRRNRFREVMNTLPAMRILLRKAIQERSNGLPLTWFVRADGQVSDLMGNSAALYNGWKKFWDESVEDGGEVGWHPHLYKRTGQAWLPIRDEKKMAIEAERIWGELTSSGWIPTSCRIGESVSSTELMNFLDTAGLHVESSALPGRIRDDGIRSFDWGETPMKPYHPAKADYRRPPRQFGDGDRPGGETPLKILEIPFTMAPVRAPYDSIEPGKPEPSRYIDLSYDPSSIQAGLSRVLAGLQYLMVIIHPLQASGRSVPAGGLVQGGIDVTEKNIRGIIDQIEKIGRTPRFMTLTGFYSLLIGEKPEVAAGSRQTEPKSREERYVRKKGASQRSNVEGRKKFRRL